MKKSKPVYHKKHAYTNLILVGVGIIVTIFLSRQDAFQSFLLHLGSLGYVGAFIAGILFVSTFTVATGSLMLLVLAKAMPPILLVPLAVLGAILGDFIIFHIVKDDLANEITDIYRHFAGKHLHHLFHTRYFRWTLPVLGAFLIASPLPDELGVTLMGISKMNAFQFVLVSLLLHSVGIFTVVFAALFFKL